MSYIGKGVETVTFNTATTLDVAGNITLGGTVDGRDVATDGTKLDTITSGAIADILQDTTPQLGGNLDLNTNNVIGTGNINVTGSITGTSFVSTGNMSFTNNSKAIFGTSPSLEIYHDGSNSILDDVGAGNFKMQLAGADKLEITSAGVSVTGSLNTTGNVGIGTVPESFAKLEVKTSTDKNIAIFDNADGPTIGAITDAGASQALRFAGQTIIMTGAGGSGAEHMRITSTGNVGIGTSPDTTPSTKLHIREDDAVDYRSRAVIQGNDQRLVAGSHWQFGVAAYSYLQATNDAETVPNSLLLNPDGGNVGIGTGSVTSGFKLEVTGDARFGDAYNDDAVELGWSSGGSQGFVQAYDRGASAFRDLSLNNSMTITSTGSVGIGVTPASKLHVNGSFRQTGATAPFEWTVNAGAADYYKLNSVGYSDNIIIATAAGNVGIGGSPASKLSVVSGTNAGITVNDGTVNTILFNTSSANGSLGTTTNHPMAFYANNAERMRILPTGGITFNGDTAAANALDDYEEGNWDPQFGGSSTTGTGSYSHYVGRYVKVGKKVSCWGIIVSSGTHSGTGNLQITGLPFNKENTYLSWGTENSIGYHSGFTSFGTATNVIRLLGPVSNGAYLRFHSFANTGDTSLAPSPVHIQNGTSVYFATTYEVQ